MIGEGFGSLSPYSGDSAIIPELHLAAGKMLIAEVAVGQHLVDGRGRSYLFASSPGPLIARSAAGELLWGEKSLTAGGSYVTAAGPGRPGSRLPPDIGIETWGLVDCLHLFDWLCPDAYAIEGTLVTGYSTTLELKFEAILHRAYGFVEWLRGGALTLTEVTRWAVVERDEKFLALGATANYDLQSLERVLSART